VHQVKVAMTNASLFAYVADGKNGMRVLQLTSPETMPEYAGFSPRPRPVLIATFKTKGEALAISKPLDHSPGAISLRSSARVRPLSRSTLPVAERS